MKVLLVYSGKSGPMRIAAELTKFLHRKGCDVYLFLLDSSEYEYDFKGIRTNFPSPFLDRLGYFGKFLRLLKLKFINFNPDVILTSFGFSMPFIRNFFPKLPIVYNMMGSPRPEVVTGNLRLKIYYIIEKFLSSFYARRVRTFTTSEYYQRYILSKWKVQVGFIHNGIDIETYCPATSEEKLRIKKELKIKNFDVVVTLGLTRFSPVYNPFYIKWYLEALRHHPEKKMLSIILGKTNRDQYQKLMRYISENAVANHEFKLFYVKPPLKYYQISDFFISFLPQSLMEKEALACGLPVITEFWEGKTAKKLLQECQHHLHKAEFIKLANLFLSDNHKLEKYSKLSRIVAERDFSSAAMGGQYLNALKSLRNRPDAP